MVAIAGMSFSTGTMLVYTFGVFAKPLASELKSSRSAIALAVSLLDLVVTFAAPGAGRLVDRYGARGVIVTSLVGLSACLVGLAYVQPPLRNFYALYALAGLIGVATTPVTYSRVIANWFDRKRGLALGLANSGVGLGAFITPSLAQFLIDRSGWRLAYMGLAGACLAIAVPVVWIFLRASPEEVGLRPDGVAPSPAMAARKPLDGMTVREAFRTRTFWLLCFIFFCVAACVNGASAHLAPLLTDSGVSVFAGAAIGVAMLWSGAAVGAAFLASALLGLAAGAEGDVMPFLVSRYFGMRSMAELFGCMFGVYTLGNATGRYFFAAGFDAGGSYKTPLACAFVALVVAILASLRLGKYAASLR